MKVFIDVNIFMYAAGRDHPFKAPSAELIQRLAREHQETVTDTEVLQEVLYRCWQAKAVDEGLRLCGQAMRFVTEVLPVGRDDVEVATRILSEQRSVEPRDAVHAAVMLNHGLTRLYSYDRHFDAIPGLTRLEP